MCGIYSKRLWWSRVRYNTATMTDARFRGTCLYMGPKMKRRGLSVVKMNVGNGEPLKGFSKSDGRGEGQTEANLYSSKAPFP